MMIYWKLFLNKTMSCKEIYLDFYANAKRTFFHFYYFYVGKSERQIYRFFARTWTLDDFNINGTKQDKGGKKKSGRKTGFSWCGPLDVLRWHLLHGL